MLKTVFMGTAELARASLQALCHAPNLQLLAVVSQPDKPRGRDLRIQPTPVKAAALACGLTVWQPARARDPAFLEQLRQLSPDLIVVAAYGQILPQTLLDVPRFGCLNVHTSLLPKYRGAAPIQCAILNGDTETGVTIMKMDAGMDTGPILTQARASIDEHDDGQTLHDRLAELGASLLLDTLPDYVAGKIQPRPQPADGASYAPKISKEDGRLDWQLPARTLGNRIRAFRPWPGAFTTHQDDGKPRLLKVWKAAVDEHQAGAAGTVLRADGNGVLVACGQHALCLKELQREGGRRLEAGTFLSGYPIQAGAKLGVS